MSARNERGSVAPLILGMALVLAVLVAAVVDASAAFLRRQELDAFADSAALAATDGAAGDAIYTHGVGAQLDVDPAAARSYVAAYVDASGIRARYPGLTFHVSTRADTVVVDVSAPMRLPLHVAGVGRRVRIVATAASVIAVD
ncbi:pilus assembly protein TadG-related protein [Nocardioides terrisoli]|uniref:pilus assembly protein TadG-related protein n=1 Tax=Nocardioides terrisoli TaxID=3388267 RepID=UPI00287B7E6E|nr:pilus assembly protein TadG-related protein [Nocardioides marmorisolisilvae]